jgi:hypothetical protein
MKQLSRFYRAALMVTVGLAKIEFTILVSPRSV